MRPKMFFLPVIPCLLFEKFVGSGEIGLDQDKWRNGYSFRGIVNFGISGRF